MDVACIGAGKTVVVTEGANQTGVVQGEGTVALSGGMLEVSNALESSRIHGLTMGSGGTLTGAATLDVSSSFAWEHESTMSGSGSTVLLPGSTGSFTLASTANLTRRTLVNEGVLTQSSGRLALAEGAEVKNVGTYKANSSPGIELGS
ncbi:MAG TPA: hypothetical protein VGL68_04505, partial [Solirubrobacteraceae bacterium]